MIPTALVLNDFAIVQLMFLGLLAIAACGIKGGNDRHRIVVGHPFPYLLRGQTHDCPNNCG